MKAHVILAILPIMSWEHEWYKEVKSVKLPLNAFYFPSTSVDFEYPTYLHVYERQMAPRPLYVDPLTAPIEGICLQTHVKTVDRSKTSLVIRRVGYYAGRQVYVIKDRRV